MLWLITLTVFGTGVVRIAGQKRHTTPDYCHVCFPLCAYLDFLAAPKQPLQDDPCPSDHALAVSSALASCDGAPNKGDGQVPSLQVPTAGQQIYVI